MYTVYYVTTYVCNLKPHTRAVAEHCNTVEYLPPLLLQSLPTKIGRVNVLSTEIISLIVKTGKSI